MKVLYFGNFDPSYSRNRVIINGLKERGVDLMLVNEKGRGAGVFFRLLFSFLHKKSQADIILVGYSDSRWPLFIARLLTKKPIFWDAFYSLYDSWVLDRGLVSKDSPKAKYYKALDQLACRAADRIILDTETHGRYFTELFSVPAEKIIRVLVSSLADQEEGVVENLPSARSESFKVVFYGKYIPLQGVEHIIEAARILRNENISFELIGKGQTYPVIRALAEKAELDKVSFTDRLPYPVLINRLKGADLILGIFGGTAKAGRVISNKVYDGIALGKAVISADTPAMREIFSDGSDIILCQPASGEALAEKILLLMRSEELRQSIAKQGLALFQSRLRPGQVVQPLVGEMEKMRLVRSDE
jgi:glycosyltransferase involved in cell wall biosynthesis